MFDLKLLKKIDWLTILLVLALLGIGLVSISSIMATPYDGTEKGVSDYLAKLNLVYVKRQIINFMVGVAAFIIMIIVDYKVYKFVIKYAYALFLGLLLLLFAMDKVRGIQGWFIIGGDRAIQPGELCKIVIIIMLAKIVSESIEKYGYLKDFKSIVKAVVLCAVPTVLVMLQPDFGTAFVYICILIAIFFIAKISWVYIGAAAGAAAAGLPLAYLYLMNDEQQKRIDVFLDPALDPLDKGYNVSQSKIAIGSGQIWGKGFFSTGTLAQLRFVPERHTDFIFAGIVEGIGFAGGTVIILLYFFLIFRWLYMAYKVNEPFGTCLIIGVMGMMLAHVFENIGMTIGLMPVTGIPLPFISYGGSNLLTNMLGVGVVENVWMRRQSKR